MRSLPLPGGRSGGGREGGKGEAGWVGSVCEVAAVSCRERSRFHIALEEKPPREPSNGTEVVIPMSRRMGEVSLSIFHSQEGESLAYLCLDDLMGEFGHGTDQPAFQTLGKIADGLGQGACQRQRLGSQVSGGAFAGFPALCEQDSQPLS